jgi:hypothetical protein
MANEIPTESRPASSLRYDAGGQAATRGNGSGWILALAILQSIGVLIFIGLRLSTDGSLDVGAIGAIGIMSVLALAFFGLWAWGRTSPLPALCWALGLFLTFHLLDAVIDPMSLARGVILKVIVIAGLLTAIIRARRTPLA